MQLQDSTPLHAAVAAGQACAAEALLVGGALVDVCDAAGATALMVAAAQGHVGCMRVLHSYKASKALNTHLAVTWAELLLKLKPFMVLPSCKAFKQSKRLRSEGSGDLSWC